MNHWNDVYRHCGLPLPNKHLHSSYQHEQKGCTYEHSSLQHCTAVAQSVKGPVSRQQRVLVTRCDGNEMGNSREPRPNPRAKAREMKSAKQVTGAPARQARSSAALSASTSTKKAVSKEKQKCKNECCEVSIFH